ncbi:MAG TPA: DUF1295 domain-containing protein [Planctomycetota bacterium]|nr:DUF1295 domain-containing protein [Planctomycetota bacterium]
MVKLLLILWAAMSVIMALFWYVQKVRSDASVVDVVWAFGMCGAALLFALAADGAFARRMLFLAIAGVWSLRLAFYLLFNRVVGKGEDGRYRKLRADWGANAQRNFLIFFQMQALFVVLFAIPFGPVVFNIDPGLSAWSIAGACVGFGAIVGEAIADAQLARFRADPDNKGKTCRAGLWGYSRHPNYFFEWTHWFAYVLMGVGGPYWWLTWFGPAVMFLFLYRVTGIPFTEKQALASRGDDYREYQRTVSAFVPWVRKKY